MKTMSSTRNPIGLWLLILLLTTGSLLVAFIILNEKTDLRSLWDEPLESLTSNVHPEPPKTERPQEQDLASGANKPITLEQVVDRSWHPDSNGFTWIQTDDQSFEGVHFFQSSSNRNELGRVQTLDDIAKISRTMIRAFYIHSSRREPIIPEDVWMSPDLRTALLVSNKKKTWRHSFTGIYWLLDMTTQSIEPLVADEPGARIQLAVWSPKSDCLAYVRENDLYARPKFSNISSQGVVRITSDASQSVLYGVPDWTYEEEVFEDRNAMWWSKDGRYLAFLQTNDSQVSEYILQTEVTVEYTPQYQQIRYPKPGSPNPIVCLLFYDSFDATVTAVPLVGDFAESERVIFNVVWVNERQVMVKQTNRESDILKVALLDASTRNGSVVREENIHELDGGWVEPTHLLRPVPENSKQGRLHNGYIDMVIHNGYNHLAYFTPLDNPTPVMLTSGPWEVVDEPVGLDLDTSTLYFVAAKESPTQRHVYKVQLDGTGFTPVTNVSEPAYYEIDFSPDAKHALLTYQGPGIPWASVVALGSDSNTDATAVAYHEVEKVATGARLLEMAQSHALPSVSHQTIQIGDEYLSVVERFPPSFDPTQRQTYPVIFYLYGGPGSQTVDQRFKVDFQSYLATLGYVVVTLDGRGTGFQGRRVRTAVRDHIGRLEAQDQIAAAQMWARRDYVDASRLAVWGWSFGGFLALKVLEQDAGATFRFGMAVAPVTDWRFYGTYI